MNKLIASTGLLAIGAVSLQAQESYTPQPGLPEQKKAKWWSVSAELRGFYDDNYTTSPRNAPESYGFEVGPSITLNKTWELTYLEAGYDYRLRWYEDDQRADEEDQMHRFNLLLDRTFTENFSGKLSEEFVSAQEPEVLAGTGPVAVPLRTEGDNVRNTAGVDFDLQLNRELSTRFGYENSWYEYDREGAGSFSSLLDRFEHLAKIDLRWHALPNTTPLVGYQYGYVDYTSDEEVFPGSGLEADFRNRESHYVFVGADHQVADNLLASARVGAQFSDYPNAPDSPPFQVEDTDDVSPYADASVTWRYAEGSNAQLGVRHERIATDLALTSLGANPVVDQETTTIYGALSHAVTAKLTANVNAQAQFGEFNGGDPLDETSEDLYLIGLNLHYQINPYLSAEAGYNFDELDSDTTRGGVDRSFDRNRYYLGVTATY